MSAEALLGEVSLPLVTPFDDGGEINGEALGRLVDHVLARGMCDSLFIAGTTGEFFALSSDERVRLFALAQEQAGGRVRLVAGTGAPTTREAVYLTRQAERLGYDAAAVIVPYYSRPTQEEIFHHFAAVAEATRLPVILYNIPLFVGVNLAPETLARLAALPNIVGVKDQAGANPVQTSDYLRVAPHLAVWCGDDAMILQVLAQGGVGAVSGGAHVVGDLIKAMIRRFKAGDVSGATGLHRRLMPFHRALVPIGRSNPIPLVRAAVTLATGIEVGPPRPPLLPPGEAEMAEMRRVLGGLDRLRTEHAVEYTMKGHLNTRREQA